MSQPLKLPQLNVVIFCGRLVADPHPLTAAGDRPGSAFTVAINRSLGRGKKAVSTFVDVTVWGDVATACNAYLGKGSAVVVTGSLANYEKKRERGAPIKVLQVSAAQIQFLNPRPDQPEEEAPE